MKRLENLTVEEIRDLLAEHYQWDIVKMAADNDLTVQEMTGVLQCGWPNDEKPDKPKTRASYDVRFVPMVDVTVPVSDPENPTEDETAAIVEAAFQAVCDNAGEKLSAENLGMVRLYRVEGDPYGTERCHYVVGGPNYGDTDPEILVELTQLTYGKLYEKYQDGVFVSGEIRSKARSLTEKYRNVDWRHGDLDFWITMEEEAEAFLVQYED